MADKNLDYYREWLEVPDGPRPPSHYVLLGLAVYEADAQKISDAAAARLRMVRPYGLKYPKESTDLLNQIAAAEVCLLDAETKAKYDRSLQGGQSAQSAIVATTPAVVSWYLQRDDQVYGPFPDRQLREMAKTGYVAADDLVWNEELAKWTPAREIRGLVFKAPRRAEAERGESDDEREPAEDEPSMMSVLETQARRFIPYKLRETALTPAEKETLTDAGMADRTERMYAAWRRTTLFAVGGVSLVAAVWTMLVAMIETEMFPANWFGVGMKALRVLAFYALPLSALGAASLWSNVRLSRWILIGGWLIGTATPLLIALVPAQYLTEGRGWEDDFQIRFGGAVSYCRVLAVFMALLPGAIRGGLWFKSLRPSSPVGAWGVTAAAAAHVVVSWIAFTALQQMIGNGLLLLAALLFIAAPLIYTVGYPWFLKPAGAEWFRNILMARGIHLAVFAFGMVIFIAFVFTRKFDDGGGLRLVGFSVDTALLRPGTLMQLILEFLARSFLTSVIVLDLLEAIHQSNMKKSDGK